MIDSSFWTIFIAMVFTLGIASGLLIVALFDLSVSVHRNTPKPVIQKPSRSSKKEPGNANDKDNVTDFSKERV
jgi:uncharacterized membrane protein YciS (DUF1049 family)